MGHAVTANESLAGSAWEFDCREAWVQWAWTGGLLSGGRQVRTERYFWASSDRGTAEGSHMYRPHLPALSVLSPTHRLAPSKVRSPVPKCYPLLLASSATPSAAVPASPHPLSVGEYVCARQKPEQHHCEETVKAVSL